MIKWEVFRDCSRFQNPQSLPQRQSRFWDVTTAATRVFLQTTKEGSEERAWKWGWGTLCLGHKSLGKAWFIAHSTNHKLSYWEVFVNPMVEGNTFFHSTEMCLAIDEGKTEKILEFQVGIKPMHVLWNLFRCSFNHCQATFYWL